MARMKQPTRATARGVDACAKGRPIRPYMVVNRRAYHSATRRRQTTIEPPAVIASGPEMLRPTIASILITTSKQSIRYSRATLPRPPHRQCFEDQRDHACNRRKHPTDRQPRYTRNSLMKPGQAPSVPPTGRALVSKQTELIVTWGRQCVSTSSCPARRPSPDVRCISRLSADRSLEWEARTSCPPP